MPLLVELARYFDLSENSGWTAIQSRLIRGYGTRRIAKLLSNGELQFTIGATERGQRLSLNETIRELARKNGFSVLKRHSTSGSRRSHGEYPALDSNREPALAVRVLTLVEGAALQGTMTDRD